jgi:DNA-binding MarR family transcriptional regulator
MGNKLLIRLKQSKPFSPQTDALLNILVAADYFRQTGTNICAQEGINFTQYNILRILNGAYPDGHPRCEIRQRLIEQGSDVTRHIDKLVAEGLAERVRSDIDKRWSVTKITPNGIELLNRLAPKFTLNEEVISQILTVEQCNQLSYLCELIYGR